MTIEERFWSKVQKTETCWLWIGMKRGNDYGGFEVMQDGVKRRQRAHRFAWELTHGPIPAGMVVCHRCDKPLCVNPDHLFLGSQHDNVMDAVRKGRMPTPQAKAKLKRGSSPKLTPAQMEAIRQYHVKYGMLLRELAEIAGCGETTIQRVISREYERGRK